MSSVGTRVQGPVELTMGPQKQSLNNMHLPTGWVRFEEVMRFCIVDLEATQQTKRWNDALVESYRRFKEEFGPLGEVQSAFLCAARPASMESARACPGIEL
jgi:hypothetical protein